MTRGANRIDIDSMSDLDPEETPALPVDAVVCIDDGALRRLRPVIRHLCVGLFDQSVKVRVITSSPEARMLASLGPVQLLVHKPLIWPLRRARLNAIINFVAPSRPSIVYAIGGGSYRIADRLANHFDADLVAQVTSGADIEALEEAFTRPVTHRIAASEPLRRELIERMGVPADEVSLVRPGVLRGAELSCFDHPERIPSMVCTTPLEPYYGIESVIEAVDMIRGRGYPILAFFPVTGSLEPALRRIVRDRNLSPNISMACATAEPVDILRAADIFIIPPEDEAVCARPLQAMANGTLVVAFEGGMADYLIDGRTAVMCPERTPEALAEILESVLSNPDYARRVASHAREYVVKNHPMSAMAEQTGAVFRQVMLHRRAIPLAG